MKRHLQLFCVLSVCHFVVAKENAWSTAEGHEFSNCKFTEEKAVCTSISEVPQNMPPGITYLEINNSPDLREIKSEYFQNYIEKLLVLKFANVGLKGLSEEAFNNSGKLEHFEIKSAPEFTAYSTNEAFDYMTNLKRLIISDCSGWTLIPVNFFSKKKNLEYLDMSYNNLQGLLDGSFDGLSKLKILDISGNRRVKTLPYNVFQPLCSVRQINISNCQITKLYPEHVEMPYYNGLISFDGETNNWYCNCMCDFIQWLHSYPNFRNISKLGYCSIPARLQSTKVLDVSKKDACPKNVDFAAVLVAALLVCVILLALCYIAATKCEGKCCKSSEPPAPRLRLRTERRTGRVNDAADLGSDTISHTEQSGDMGGWRITDIDPPSYDVAVKYRNGIDEVSIEHVSETDSMEGIPPPEYTENITEEVASANPNETCI